MPQVTVTSQEATGAAGVPTGTGAVGVVGTADAGPPPSGPGYAHCTSLQSFADAFGPRSDTNATLYDWLEEFFADGGADAYVVRVTDSTATTATLTLDDGQATPEPTVAVSALSAGTEGNLTFVTVAAGSGTPFTATTASASTGLTAVSSFKNVGVGTPVTGTGIAAKTYVTAIDTAAKTATLSVAATAAGSAVSITPGTITVTVTAQDAAGDTVATEEHGPYYLTSQLIADTKSGWVTFAQSSATGFTTNLPAVIAATALSGGADASDLTDSSYVSALASLPASLGPMQVAIPGHTTQAIWDGIRDHCNTNNRFGILDMQDASNATTAAGSVSLDSGDWTRCVAFQGSGVIDGINGGPPRTVAGSAMVAAARARVAATANQNQAPIATRWPLNHVLGFTTYFGTTPGATNVVEWTQDDVNTLEAAGINVFANFYGTLCLYGFVTLAAIGGTEQVYDQASASAERMALTADIQAVLANYEGVTIDGANAETTQMQTDVVDVCGQHYSTSALYGATPSDAYAVKTDSPVNTTQTAQAGQLNVQVQAKFSRYADKINGTIIVVPLTGTVVQEVAS
ncbi:MAG: hypothetical protein ACRDNS_02150 [Trebonia sp.]